MYRFAQWLRISNEAAPFRIAFALNDKMPNDFGLRAKCFHQIQAAAETAWEATKQELDL
jgi:hypothetical protein